MALLSLNEFAQISFEKGGRFLGCDVGEKTIGLALSDVNLTIATPFDVIRRTQWKMDSKTLLKIFSDHHIVGIVVGLPLNMDGSEGPRCQSIRQFSQNVLALSDIPLCLWDERLSTVAVTRTLLEADVSREKRKKVIDKMAASYILQGFLDGLRNKKSF
ncbi:MAG: Holliday junction resolvase RuvX [Alphaproteobacteria bacterium]|nr:Holliday junction resolvase RuvX [Alphaproteobacteria bacterium]